MKIHSEAEFRLNTHWIILRVDPPPPMLEFYLAAGVGIPIFILKHLPKLLRFECVETTGALSSRTHYSRHCCEARLEAQYGDCQQMARWLYTPEGPQSRVTDGEAGSWRGERLAGRTSGGPGDRPMVSTRSSWRHSSSTTEDGLVAAVLCLTVCVRVRVRAQVRKCVTSQFPILFLHPSIWINK